MERTKLEDTTLLIFLTKVRAVKKDLGNSIQRGRIEFDSYSGVEVNDV